MTAASPSRAIITEALRKIDDLSARLEIAEKGDTEPIAVVGIGCRFPGGVHSPGQYWRLLLDGASGVVRVPAQRWDADAYFSADYTVPGTICSREGGFLTSWEPDEFDAEFFGISPREAAGMDPQQRLLMEVAWEALENAGITGQAIRETQTGIFVGSTTNDYSLTFAGKLRPEDIDPYIPFGNAPSFAAGRLAYFLGVHGPAVVLDTACSSSLVAVHLACQSLRRRESDQALAAGVNLMLSPENSIACSRWGMLSVDGRCKTFDAAADGYVRSEGAGVVVLKRLDDAVRDRDRVLAVVRGSAVNQDGPSSGQTVPSGPAQQAVLRQALAASRLAPSDIDYIEAHGTGTALGDPIELDALSQVFSDRNTSAPLVLGSVKTNLGHLESASGIAGFIKTVLSVHHGYIPEHLNFERLTPHAGEAAARFTIAAQPMQWPAVGRARRAGVSSFGVSGTNAHVVIEQAPTTAQPVAREPEPVVSTLVVSGKTPSRIASTAAMLAEWMVGDGAEVPLADVAHTINHHRTRYKYVAAVSARDRAQAVTGLQALAAGEVTDGVVEPYETTHGPGPVFVYSGQGSQWAGMARQLLLDEAAFAAAVAELEPAFLEHIGFSLHKVLANGEPVAGDARVQPVIMGLQLALTELWRSHGVQPAAVIGHSMGEVTAAVVAGALTVPEGLRVIATRSQLMSRLAGQGAVALLEMDAEAASALIADYPGVSLTVYSSPRQTVVSGPVAPVDAVIAAVAAQDRFARRVNMEVASHTAFMDPILPELRSALTNLMPKAAAIPFISTITDVISPTLDADYWVDNVRQPVRFSQAVTTAAVQHSTFVEISPHPTLINAITETLGSARHRSIGTLSRDGDDAISFHSNLNNIHSAQPPSTPRPPGPRPVLPATPWRHTRHWITIDNPVTAAESAPRPGTLLGEHIAVASTPAAHLWQARLTPRVKPYKGSHRVHGAELVPASVVVQTLLAAAAEFGAPLLSDVRLESPIPVDQPRMIQVVADNGSVTVSSRPADSATQPWVRHAGASITERRDHDQAERPDGGNSRNGHETAGYDTSLVAELQEAWGIEGQPFGWSIGTCRSTAGSLYADVKLSDVSTVALLDAALHVARLVDTSSPQLMFPAAVDSVRLNAELVDDHGAVEVHRLGGNDDELLVDIVVKAPDGSTCIDIRGLRYVAGGSGLASTTPAVGDPRTLAHAIEWQPWVPPADSQQAPDASCTLAVVGAEGASDSLRGRLAEAGYAPSDVAQARYIVYVADPGLVDAAETDIDCAVRLSAEVADLVRGLAERADRRATLWIITRGVREAASDAAVRQSCLWGIAGVVRAEQPELWGGLIDLPAGDDIGDYVPALSRVLRTPAKSILALDDDAFLAPVVLPVSGEPVRERLQCRPDAAYLITGGLGALGLLMADWLVDRGARRLVLAGRSPLPPRRDWIGETNDADTRHKIAAIRALEARGVSVDAVVLDVGSRDAVHALLARRDDAGAPPICGVIHAAGVTDGQLLTEIDQSRLRRTMWPKISGAQVLHEAFPPRSLDFFFLTAAAGAVFGVPGQGAYAAANAYLDGLARARHRQDCHTVSLDWVAWQGLGFAADAQVVLDELERLGSRPVTPEEAFPAWEYVDTFDIAQAVMVPMSSDQPVAGTEVVSAPVRAWSEMAADDLLSELEAGLRTILGRELRLPEADLDVDRPFAELGLNSVMAMSIRREAEQMLGIELAATMLWNHPTITSLTAFLANKLVPQIDSDDDFGMMPDVAGSVLNDLFDSVESAPACGERGS